PQCPHPALRLRQPEFFQQKIHGRTLQVEHIKGLRRIVDSAHVQREFAQIRAVAGDRLQAVEYRDGLFHRRNTVRAEEIQEILVKGIVNHRRVPAVFFSYVARVSNIPVDTVANRRDLVWLKSKGPEKRESGGGTHPAERREGQNQQDSFR